MKTKRKFYTGTGDDGTTGLLGEGRVEKFDTRMEALGTLDELSAVLGLARSLVDSIDENLRIIALQKKIYELMAEVAATAENANLFHRITPEEVCGLEKDIDRLSMEVDIPDGFIVPGANGGSAAIALARTVTRRAERRVAELLKEGKITNQDLLRYLNRLSSLFFVLELHLTQLDQQKPTMARDTK
jgi:cob(I)alamin adenosyltransferase